MDSTCDRLKQVMAWLIANGEASSQREVAMQLGYTPSSLSQISDFFGLLSGFFAMNDLGNFLRETFLTSTCGWILGMFGHDLIEFFWRNESEVFEVIFDSVIGLIEPELIEVENTSLFGIKPDGVTFGLAEFAAGDFVDDKRAGITVGFGVFEAFN